MEKEMIEKEMMEKEMMEQEMMEKEMMEKEMMEEKVMEKEMMEKGMAEKAMVEEVVEEIWKKGLLQNTRLDDRNFGENEKEKMNVSKDKIWRRRWRWYEENWKEYVRESHQ